MTTTAEIEVSIRDSAQRIVRAWVKPDAVLGHDGRGRACGPTVPLDGAWLVRDAVRTELAYWVHAADDEGVAVVLEGERLDMSSPVHTAGHLRDHAAQLAEWGEYGRTLAGDLRRLAGDLDALVRGPKTGVVLGPCPVEVVDAEGQRAQCGTPIRREHGEVEATCGACGTTETAEEWARLMGVEVGPITAEAMCERLLLVGIRTTPNGLRMRAARGSIPRAVKRDTQGRPLYDLTATVAALGRREEVDMTAT